MKMQQLFYGENTDTWNVKLLDIEKVKELAQEIIHEPWQDVCIIREYLSYIEIITYNEQIHSSFGRFVIAPDYFWGKGETKTKRMGDDSYEKLVGR